MTDYLLLIRESDAKGETSPDSMQDRIGAYMAWVEGLGVHFVSGRRLEPESAFVKSRDLVYTDGPFVESKEIVAGFVILRADSFEAALALTKSCPLLSWFDIVLRPVVGE